MIDGEPTAPEPPAITIVFDGPHSTNSQIGFSSSGVDVGQMIIARDLIAREIDSFFRKIALMEAQKPKGGLVVPGAVIPRRVE